MAEQCTDYEDDERKLGDIFDDALDIYERINKGDEVTSSVRVQVEVKNCISLLEEATNLINAAGVFSSNETIEEIPSQNIKYLLIPALLGSLVLKVQSTERLNALEAAEVYFKDYLKRVYEYDIVRSFSLEELEETETAEAGPRRTDIYKLAMQRTEKIRKYNEQKEQEAELMRLKELLIQGDDETSRNYYITYIRNFVITSLDELRLIKQEKPLAKHLAESREKGSYNEERTREEDVELRPFKPIIITRNELQKKVFGAGYPSLPTMTVEEFYRQRVEEGIFPAQGSHHGKVLQEMTDPEVVKRQEEDEEILKETEIETDDPKYLAKTRSMDEYKDNHKRGWGNRMNRS